MPRDPFDALPAPDLKKFVAALKRHLRTALESLERFSNSVRSGRYPEWPSKADLSLFMRQIEAFRLISRRSAKARSIHLIREMDHRWPRMMIIRTLDNALFHLEEYIGCSLLGDATANAWFRRQSDSAKSHLRALILREQGAEPVDLKMMAHQLPIAFQVMIDLTSGKDLGWLSAAPAGPAKRFRAALSRAAQEYLITKHHLYVARLVPAKELRSFFFELKHPPYKRRLFGFSSDHIEVWKKVDRKDQTRTRVRRFRGKQPPFSVTRSHRKRKRRRLS